MNDRTIGLILTIIVVIGIAGITYFATLLPVADNWVPGQALPKDR